MGTPNPPTGALARIGAGSPLYIAAIYGTGCLLSVMLIALGKRVGNPGLAPLGALILLVAFALAYTVVTWHRDDDTVAAGFLLGVSVVLSSYVIGLLLMGIAQGALGGAALAFGFGVLGLVIQGVLAVVICIGLIWVGRLIRPGIATPVPPPRRH